MSRSKLSDFEILTRLGSGSFGTVYKVRRLVDDSLYVIKNVRIVELTYKEQSEAINEVQILAQLKSPYVVRYYDSFIEKECLHIVMEYCNRGDLQVLIKKAKEKNVTCLKEDVIWNIALQVILGLQYLHKRHILHRDLKSANVFLMKDPNFTNYLVKIGDLGVAKQMDTSTALANTIVGTPYYLSPELCADMPYKDKSDCWAFGVLLYQCCTLNHPFEARNQCALIMKIIEAQVKPPSSSNISPELTNLIMWVLQKDPQLRPSMKEILCEEFIRAKLVSHNFELPSELEEFPTTTFLNSKTPPAPSVSVLDTESAMLKEKMHSFHRKVNADHSTAPLSRQGSNNQLKAGGEGTAGGAAGATAGGATGEGKNIGLPPPKRAGSMRSTVSSSTGSGKSGGVAGNRVRPGATKTISVKALTIHQVKPPPSVVSPVVGAAGSASPGTATATTAAGTATTTPRRNSTPRVSVSSPGGIEGAGNDDSKSVHEPVTVAVDTQSQDKASAIVTSSSTSDLKIGSNSNLAILKRQQSKSNKEIVIDTSDEYPQQQAAEYKAEAKGTFVKKLSRPAGGGSRNVSYKDIPDAPLDQQQQQSLQQSHPRGSSSSIDAKLHPPESSAAAPSLSIVTGNEQFSPPSEQPSITYDNEAFEEYDSEEASPSNAKTQNRQRPGYHEHKLGGDAEEEIDMLKTPFITMGPLKSFRTAPVEEKSFSIPDTPSHGHEIDQMFYSESSAALKYEQTMQQQQQLSIAQWSRGHSKGASIGNNSNGTTFNGTSTGSHQQQSEGRRSADVTYRRTEPMEVGIAHVGSDELEAEDAELFAHHGLSDDESDSHGHSRHSRHSHGHGGGHSAASAGGAGGGGGESGANSDEDLNSVDGNEEDDGDEEEDDAELDEKTVEMIDQAQESQLKNLTDLINDSKARSIAKFGTDLFGKIYELCARHMGISENKAEQPQETTMGPRGTSFMKELERYVMESGKGIEVAREAVMGIKVLLALESKYEEVLETNHMLHAPRK